MEGLLCHCRRPAVRRVSKRLATVGCSFYGCPGAYPCKPQGSFLGWVPGQGPTDRLPAVSVAPSPASTATPPGPLTPTLTATVTVSAALPSAASSNQMPPQVARPRSRSRTPEPNRDSVSGRLKTLQARLEPVQGGLPAEPFGRPSSHPLQLFGEKGKARRDKALLDERFVDVRLVDLELRLARRAAPPFEGARAAVLYLLAIPIDRMGGNMKRRAELEGASLFYKAGVISSSSWLSRGLLTKPGQTEQEWARKAVAHSYQHRIKGHKFWSQVFGDATRLENIMSVVASARLVLASDAATFESILGQALAAEQGVVSLRDPDRWRAPDELSGSFWHFVGPPLGAAFTAEFFPPE